jgi:toxin ParE1/3/4
MATISDLADGKRIGRPAGIRQGYFKCATGSHFVFYRQSDSSLDVIRVLHQRMDAPTYL